MTRKRKKTTSTTEWLRLAEFVRRSGVARSTVVGRVSRGEYRSKMFGDVLFIAWPIGEQQSSRGAAA